MSVRHSLLAILAEHPTHGYGLKSSFEKSTAGTWPLNVGQVYTTLGRLERGRGAWGLGSDEAPMPACTFKAFVKQFGKRGGHRYLASQLKAQRMLYAPETAEPNTPLPIWTQCNEAHPGWCAKWADGLPQVVRDFVFWLHQSELGLPPARAKRAAVVGGRRCDRAHADVRPGPGWRGLSGRRLCGVSGDAVPRTRRLRT